MSVVIETTSGDVTVDLYLKDRPRACLNFLKLCKIKYYNFNLFHTISRGFIAQTGDPTGSRKGGESVYGVLDGLEKRYFEGEKEPRIKHTKTGLISFVGNDDGMIGSQFFFTLGEDLTYLDDKHCVFGEIVEGFEILEEINEAICDNDDRPYQDIRITHTVVLDDPFPNPKRLHVPERSPSPSAERLQGGRIAADEDIDETQGKSQKEIAEMQAECEAKARATILEMVGDLPDAEMAPPENVLFVCKLNPVTNDDDLEIIFSRFGKIVSCEVIRDRKTGDSLQYAFVEFRDRAACEQAYFKMDNVLIDDRRIHVDFSQSVSKVKWYGKGKGVAYFNDRGQPIRDQNRDVGKGKYKINDGRNKNMNGNHRDNTKKQYNDRNNYNRYESSRKEMNSSRRDKDRREHYRSRDRYNEERVQRDDYRRKDHSKSYRSEGRDSKNEHSKLKHTSNYKSSKSSSNSDYKQKSSKKHKKSKYESTDDSDSDHSRKKKKKHKKSYSDSDDS